MLSEKNIQKYILTRFSLYKMQTNAEYEKIKSHKEPCWHDRNILYLASRGDFRGIYHCQNS